MAHIVVKNCGTKPVDTIRGLLSTFCTSSSDIEYADCSCSLRPICCVISRKNISTYSCLHIHVIKNGKYTKKSYLLFFFFLISSLNKFFFCDSSSYKIWDQKIDTSSFGFQVKSSRCWNWNLPYPKFWEVSRSLKVSPKKIFVLLLILFWKVPPAWRWTCICVSRWKSYRKSVILR